MKIYIILINFIILFINIIFFIHKIFRINNKYLMIKNSDLYIFLNIFFKNKEIINPKKYENTSQKIKVTITCKDTLNNTNCIKNYKKKLEQLNYIVENNDDNPDYIIYDVFGCEHTQKKYIILINKIYSQINLIFI